MRIQGSMIRRREGSAHTRSGRVSIRTSKVWFLSSEQWKATPVTKQGGAVISENCALELALHAQCGGHRRARCRFGCSGRRLLGNHSDLT